MFQYMLLLRGATFPDWRGDSGQVVSIHAPLARSNFHAPLRQNDDEVSIHAPLARSNFTGRIRPHKTQFQYMLLLRGATDGCVFRFAGGNRFNTCSSCEEQLDMRPVFEFVSVSIHAPLARSNEI